MNRKQIIREKYVLKQLIKFKSPQSIPLSRLSELTNLKVKLLEEIVLNLLTKRPLIGSYDTGSGELHLVSNSYQEIDRILKSYPKPYYEYIPLIRDDKEVTEEEFQYISNELCEKIKDKLKGIVAIPKDQNITLTDLAELNLKRDKISRQEANLLRDFDVLMIQGETISSELLLKLSSMHTRLIHVAKWIYSD